MSNSLIMANVMVVLSLIVYTIISKRSKKNKSHKRQEEKRFRLYEVEEDPQVRHYRRGNFITTHPDDTDRMGEAYADNKWRFTMPHMAVDLLIECFSGDEKKAYQIKRAIEIAIEHYTIEMADDLECLTVIKERLGNTL